MQLFYCPNIQKGETYLNQEESRHCVKSLRKKSGDIIHITDGNGNFYVGIIEDVSQKKCTFQIQSKKSIQKPDYSVHIAIAPTKNSDRIEWFIEKSVEIGVQKISLIQSAFSERKTINFGRMEKKAISALKQSMRAYFPEIIDIKNLSSFLEIADGDQKFVAHLENIETEHLRDLAKPKKSYLIIIGPEGGFSDQEITMIKDKDYKMAKIGNHRLRTETAGIVACTILNDINC